MWNHHKIFSLVNQYTSCCFIVSVYVDQCHELYEPRYGGSLCYVIPCIMAQKIFEGFLLSFISFVILFSHSLLRQLECTPFSHNINIICFHISCIKMGLLYQNYSQDFAVWYAFGEINEYVFMQGYVLFPETVGGKLDCQNHKQFPCINSSECIFPSHLLASLILLINI
jgi:hypothetical protein